MGGIVCQSVDWVAGKFGAEAVSLEVLVLRETRRDRRVFPTGSWGVGDVGEATEDMSSSDRLTGVRL